MVMMAILARGHILIEDIPGVGKTTMALAFSRACAMSQNRVQFTPDVLPADITGFSIYRKDTGKFEYQPGATCFWQTRSTVHPRKHSPHCWK